MLKKNESVELNVTKVRLIKHAIINPNKNQPAS
jgi:hypothetical protein